MFPLCCAVRIVQRKLGWREVGDEEDWEVYWTDTSVGIERIIKLNKVQVGLEPRAGHTQGSWFSWPLAPMVLRQGMHGGCMEKG